MNPLSLGSNRHSKSLKGALRNAKRLCSKTQNGRFPCKKIPLHLKKVCFKVFYVNTFNDRAMAFTVLSNRAQMFRGGRPLLREN